jgi:5-formyltetrahydrofolate cyclo-ligase
MPPPGSMDPLDPRLVADLAVRAKKQLRARMRALRSAHPEKARAERSARLVARVIALPEFVSARGVALFASLLDGGEVDVRALDQAARTANKRIFYPTIERKGDRDHTALAEVSDPTELAMRGRRFAEPPESARRAARGDVDLVVVPALALAATGHRLGYGGGFYDAMLPDFCPPAVAVAVAFDFQLIAELPAEPHDVPCDIVVTDARTLVARTSA